MNPAGLRSSFAPAFWLLPTREREALIALHRFCRALDQAVDGEPLAPEEAEVRLARWRDEVQAIFAGREPSREESRVLAPHVRAFGMRRRHFLALLDALAEDVRGPRFATEADLIRYCEGVASAPGYLALAVFGCSEASTYAHALGVALQRTNILRDLREDLTRGRLYLPLADLERHGLGPSDLTSGERETGADLRRLIDFERRRAGAWFEASERAYREQPPRTRRRLAAARGMERIYRDLLRRLDREEALPRRRARASRPAVMRALVSSWFEAHRHPAD